MQNISLLKGGEAFADTISDFHLSVFKDLKALSILGGPYNTVSSALGLKLFPLNPVELH